MKTGRGRLAVLTAAGISFAVLAAAAWLGRGLLIDGVEVFFRLRSADPEHRRAAVEALGERGGGWTVRYLVNAAIADASLAGPVVDALEKMLPRVVPENQERIVEGLIEVLQSAQKTAGNRDVDAFADLHLRELEKKILDLAAKTPAAFPALVKQMSAAQAQKVPSLAAVGLARGWPASREILEEYFSGPEAVDRARWFFAAADLHALAAHFAKTHSDPCVRTLSLVYLCRSADRESPDLRGLVEAYTGDPDPRVRAAALRVTGLVGPSPTGIDLGKVIVQENDPAILVEAIGARTLWMDRYFCLPRALEAWPGFVVPAPYRIGRDLVFPLRAEESGRLEALLAKSSISALRDAASLALAPRPSPPSVKAETPEPPTGLEVHEWGVWLDGGGTLIPASSIVEELPAFVHRSKVGAGELWSSRANDDPGVLTATKPVIYFHAAKPLVLLVGVGFAGGRPWTFLPEITDYLEMTDTTRVRVGLGLDIKQGISFTPFQDADGLSPPWLKPWDGPGTPRHVALTNQLQRDLAWPPVPAAGSELVRRYEAVPWAVPRHPEHGAALSTEWLTGIGLEWRGLRVGYGKALEGEFPPVAPGTWWARLREVPASPVALRGDHEAFLFYDGSIGIPSPASVDWKDATHGEVVLTARSGTDLRGPVPVLEKKGAVEFRPGPVPLVLVVQKSPGRETVGAAHRRLEPARGPVTVSLDRLPLEAPELRRVLRDALQEEGLTSAEVGALLSTFEWEFFGKDGGRAITLVQRAVYDRALPITILPAPDRMVRAGLVLKELR